jgi:hypothetical protein
MAVQSTPITRTIIVKEVPVLEPSPPQINRTYKITKTTTTTHHGVPPPPPPPISLEQFNPEQIKQSFAHLQQQAALAQSHSRDEYAVQGGQRIYRSSSQFPEQPIQQQQMLHNSQQQQHQSVKTTSRSSSIPASQRTQFSADDGSVYTTETVTNPNSTTTRFYTTRKYTTSGNDQDAALAGSNSGILRTMPASPRPQHTVESARSVVNDQFQQQQQRLADKRQSQTMSSSSTSATKSFTPINNIISQGGQGNHSSTTCVDYSNSYFNSEHGSGHSAKHVVESGAHSNAGMNVENSRPMSIPIIQQGGSRPSAFSSSGSAAASANSAGSKSKVKIR